ncbi:MAG TPA: T9SS type A sorting domain-containing protein, partial [Chitinophagales bacterium]|nr:T9SS type A sorting domain-containing protein [Chitinophagales bacterium]
TRWYYFYDWSVSGDAVFVCPSDRTGTEVEVKVCSSIGDISTLNSLDIYPNPTNGQFTVNLNTLPVSEMQITVCNVTGAQVYSTILQNPNGSVQLPVDISGVASGVYQVKLTANGKSISRSIVVE